MPSSPREFAEKLEQLCDCDGRRLNGRARELANELREYLASRDAEIAHEAKREMRDRAVQIANEEKQATGFDGKDWWGSNQIIAERIRALPLDPPAPAAAQGAKSEEPKP